jgi:hypothetical protein
MAATTEQLLVQIDAQTEQLRRSLREADERVGRFQKSTNTHLQRVDKRFRELNRRTEKAMRAFRGLAGAGVALAGGAGLGLLVNRSLEAAANIEDLANRAGVGTDALQELTFAAGQFGVQEDTLVDGLKELQVRLDEFAQDGGGPGADTFRRLGISAQDATRLLRQSDRGMQEIINRIRELDSTAARARAFEEIFGDEAGQQIRQITGDLDQLRQRARDLGLVIDRDLIEKSDEARDRFQTLSDVVSKRVTAAVADLAPALDNLFKGIIDQLPGVISDIELFAKRLGVISEVSERTQLRELRDQAADLRRELELSSQGIIQGAGRALQSLGEDSRDVAAELRKVNREIGILTGDTDPLGRLNTPGELGGGPPTPDPGTGGAGAGGGGGSSIDVPTPGRRPDQLQPPSFEAHQRAQQILAEQNEQLTPLSPAGILRGSGEARP